VNAPPIHDQPGRQHYGLTLLVLISAALAFSLSQTMVVPALPDIQRELGGSQTTTTFVLTAFLLTASVATPILGRLGDMFGKERVLVMTLCVFALGSLVAALSHSIEVLIAGRAIQGAAGAVFPLAFGIIRDEFPAARVATGIGLISATFGVGAGVGVVLSGVIVDSLSYEWIFWLGLPLVLFAIAATWLFVPESPVKSPAKIDWGGAGLLGLGLTSLLVGVSEGNSWGWDSPRILGLFGLALVILAAWIRYESRHPQPMVDMKMMRRPAVATTNATAFLVGFGMIGSFILIPQMVQLPASTGFGFGASVTEGGLFLLPSAIAMLAAGPISGLLGDRGGSKLPLLIGTVTAMSSFAFLAAFHSTHLSIYIGSALLGVGIGFAFAAMANLIVDAVEQTEVGVATGINTIMRTIGGSLGGQISAALIAGHLAANGLPEERGFVLAFGLSAIGLAVATLAAAAIPVRSRSQEPLPPGEPAAQHS
jgi:EmrB/QacA subfamily drug resistance transporter